MSEVNVSETVAAPAARVWEVLGDFGGVLKWGGKMLQSCTVEGSGVGAVRRIGLPGGGEIVAEGPRLVTTDLVLAEAVVVVRARAGFDLSVRAGERLLADPFEIVWVDRALLDDAWRLYRRYRDHDLSLCDCVSFAVMRRRKIDTAFAYDRDFEAVGFSQARPVGES